MPQLSYVSGGRPHGVLVSVDGRGAVTLHHPAALSDSTALAPGEPAPLGHAYELDDAPDFERFLFVTSEEPLDVASVLEELGGVQPQDRLMVTLHVWDESFTTEQLHHQVRLIGGFQLAKRFALIIWWPGLQAGVRL